MMKKTSPDPLQANDSKLVEVAGIEEDFKLKMNIVQDVKDLKVIVSAQQSQIVKMHSNIVKLSKHNAMLTQRVRHLNTRLLNKKKAQAQGGEARRPVDEAIRKSIRRKSIKKKKQSATQGKIKRTTKKIRKRRGETKKSRTSTIDPETLTVMDRRSLSKRISELGLATEYKQYLG